MKISVPLKNISEKEQKLLHSLKENKELNLSGEVIDILYNRGIKTEDEIKQHLYATLEDMHPAYLLKDSDKFVTIVKAAIENKEEIVNYSDYDADGITSASVVIKGIRNAGGIIHYYTNNRFIEGYGITKNGIDHMLKKYPNTKLIITTDNGIVANEAVDYANSLGLKVIITDHHEPGDTLPNALAIINPKRKDCPYPFKGLCGVGVIFKLMLLLYFEMDLDLTYVYNLLDIVAVGTVGDMVPMIDENRIFVREGIKKVKNEDRIVFKKLREALSVSQIDEETFGFLYCPILNALGRIDGSPDDAIELLTIDDEERMEEIIEELVCINKKRKTLTKEQEKLAMQMIESMDELPSVIVLHHASFHEGVVGLVAGRLKERYYRPTIVLALNQKEVIDENGTKQVIKIWKGSARSIEGFHIKENFDSVNRYLLGYGGHAMAGGMSIMEENLIDFEKAINERAKNLLTEEDFVKKIIIDSVLTESNLSIEQIKALNVLKPFGMEFSRPKFAITNFEVDETKFKTAYVGADKNTLRLISKNNVTLLMFRHAKAYTNLKEPKLIKAIGSPGINVFQGKESVQFIVEHDYIYPYKKE